MELKPGLNCNNTLRCPDIPNFTVQRNSSKRPSSYKLDGVCYPDLSWEELAAKCLPDCACKAIGEDGCLRYKRNQLIDMDYVDFCYAEVTPERPNCTCRPSPGYTVYKGRDHDGNDIPDSCSREMTVLQLGAECLNDTLCCYSFHERGCEKSVPTALDPSNFINKTVGNGVNKRAELDFCYYARQVAPVCSVTPPPASSSLSSGAIIGISVGCGLLAALAVMGGYFFWRRRGAARAKRAPTWTDGGVDGYGTEKAAALINEVSSEALPIGYKSLDVPGLQGGEAFMRGTAYAYKWLPCPPEERGKMTVVEAGVNDASLDSQADPDTGLAGPAVQLTAADVGVQIQLLQGGLLGRGATALVFECVWPSRFGPKAVLAAKVLKDGYEPEPSFLQSFTYEAAVLASLYPPHDNVVRLYGYCLEPPTVCLIMELLPRSLKDVLYKPLQGSDAGSSLGASMALKDGSHKHTPPLPDGSLASSITTIAGGAPTHGEGEGELPASVARPPPSHPVAESPFLQAALQQAASASGRGAVSADGCGGSAGGAQAADVLMTITKSPPASLMVTPLPSEDVLQPVPSSTIDSAITCDGSYAGPVDATGGQAHTLVGASVGNAGSGAQPARAQPLTMAQVVRVSTDIAAALKFLHERPLAVQQSLGTEPMSEQGSVVVSPSPGGLPLLMSLSSVAELPSEYRSQSGPERPSRATHIIHRDLKPANILLNSLGTAKLSDFGLARPQQRTTLMTDHLGAGTLAYMSPEQLAGNVIGSVATERVDIYATAIIMWEMLAGRPPWTHLPQSAVVVSVLRGRRPELPGSAVGAIRANTPALQAMASRPAGLDVCPEYNAIIRAAWQQREQRRPSAAALHEMLTALLAKIQSVESGGASGSAGGA